MTTELITKEKERLLEALKGLVTVLGDENKTLQLRIENIINKIRILQFQRSGQSEYPRSLRQFFLIVIKMINSARSTKSGRDTVGKKGNLI